CAREGSNYALFFDYW
nr:immunoglobulin heavy chain junction region [Mus musculus]MBK4198470.1 immunoglobulin heavy chain junction region [Mus musculus]